MAAAVTAAGHALAVAGHAHAPWAAAAAPAWPPAPFPWAPTPAADVCANATYGHRVDDVSRYNFCAVPGSGRDAALFGAVAVLAAVLATSVEAGFSEVFVLLAGGAAQARGGRGLTGIGPGVRCGCTTVACPPTPWPTTPAPHSRPPLPPIPLQAASFAANMGSFSNSMTLWLGIRPADIFLAVFLPPLLLYSAVTLDLFVFRKARGWTGRGGVGGWGGAGGAPPFPCRLPLPPQTPNQL